MGKGRPALRGTSAVKSVWRVVALLVLCKKGSFLFFFSTKKGSFMEWATDSNIV